MSRSELTGAANALIADVLSNNVHRVEKRLAEEKLPWKQVISFDLDLQQLLSHDLKDDSTLIKLLSFEVSQLSIWHLAAVFGHTDILVNFLDKDIPVDLATPGGITALHLASFTGQGSTVRILTYVYHANINCTDRYGWSPLHYAASGGDIDVVQMLLDEKCDLTLRDKDGTTAAFRAKTEGHNYIAELLVRVGGSHLLNIEDQPPTPTIQPAQPKVFQFENIKPNESPSKITKHDKPETVDGTDNAQYGKVLPRQHSTPEMGMQFPAADGTEAKRRNTLPAKPQPVARHKSIRRMIREQLEVAFNEPLYETPVTPGDEDTNDKPQPKKKMEFGFGMETLKGILKEEILKYKVQMESEDKDDLYESLDDHQSQIAASSNRSSEVRSSLSSNKKDDDDDDDEPPYMQAPPVPLLPGQPRPELPPRNIVIPPPLPPRRVSVDSVNLGVNTQQRGIVTDKAVLISAVKQLAPKLGNYWQSVALALPIDKSVSKSKSRIQSIVKQYPADNEKQALIALSEWVINHGKTASIDDVTIALRSCGLNDLVMEIQSYAQEFSA